jgi:putative flippase GtrA
VAHRVLIPWLMQLRRRWNESANAGKWGQMIAAGLGGAVGAVFDVSTLILLVERGTPVALAAFMAAGVGAVVCFVLNKHVAFRDRTPVTWQQLGRFGSVAVATALLMAAAMQVFAVKLGVQYVVAKVLCSALIFLVWTYPAQRRLVFRRHARAFMSLS